MPLILTSPIQYSETAREVEGVLKRFILVPESIFTEAYEISNKAIIHGSIENIGIWESSYGEKYDKHEINGDFATISEELKDTPFRFIFVRTRIGTYDRLYFSGSSWESLRDFGIVPGIHFIRVKITTVTQDESPIIEIFPHRDVRIIASY